MGMLSGARVPLAAMDKSRSISRKGSNLVTDIAASWCGVCPGTMCGLGSRGPLTRQGGSPAAPHSGLPAAAGGEGVYRVAAPGQGPWPGEPTSGSYICRPIMRGTAITMSTATMTAGPMRTIGGSLR